MSIFRKSIILTLLLLASCAQYHEPAAPASAGPSNAVPPSVLLWNDGAPGALNRDTPEVVGSRTEPSSATVEEITFATVSNVNNPSITPFLPEPGTATGAAVIIAPGGGHQFLAIEHEGYAEARVFAAHGVATFVLKYRLAKAPNSPYKVEV